MSTKKVTASAKPAKVTKAPRRTAVRKSVAKPARETELAMPAEPVTFAETRPVSRVVYLAGCSSCNHVPLGVNMVLGVLVAIVITLSAMLMASSVTVRGNATQISAYHRLLSSPAVAEVRKIH